VTQLHCFCSSGGTAGVQYDSYVVVRSGDKPETVQIRRRGLKQVMILLRVVDVANIFSGCDYYVFDSFRVLQR